MVESTLSIQIGAVFIMAVVSVAGIGLPFMKKDDLETDLLRIAKAGSAGIMLALALVSKIRAEEVRCEVKRTVNG
jgi:hypothetical protein